MRRCGLLFGLLLLVAGSAEASGVDGLGRISIGGGWRWVPNWYFASKAEEAGRPLEAVSSGGPQGTASFSLGVNSWLEVAVDLFIGYEGFRLAPQEQFSSVSYGGVIGARLVATDVLFKGFMPYLSLQAGPMLSSVASPQTPNAERLLGALSAAGGATWRFAERYGVSVEARWIYGRLFVPGISGINVGGVWFSASFVIFIPATPKRDLEAPGF